MTTARAKGIRRAVYLIVAVALIVGFFANRRGDLPLETLKANWANAESRFIEIEGMQVHYRDEGTGPPVVLLHGNSASLHTWDGWTAELRGHYRVVRVDLPGFGLTGPSPTRDYRIPTYVRFVELLLDRLAVSRCVLAGNSMGGAIAWTFALEHPSRVGALVLVDALGYPLPGSGLPLAFRVARWPVVSSLLVQIDPRWLVVDGVNRVYADPSRIRPGVVDRYYEMALRPGNRTAFFDVMRTMLEDDSARIKSVRAPTLVLWGARDRLISVAAAHRFAADIPGARLIVYDDLGHVPMEEDPARTARDVERFLSSLATP
jgi:pimeloyl-ACP methyl ester carboxylesterase